MTQYFLGLLDSNVMLWTNSKAHKRVYTVIWDFSSSNDTISKIPYSWFAKDSVIYDTRKVFKVFENAPSRIG